MNNFILKLIAIITMLIDHIGYFYFPDVLFFRFIGRIAFPIYAFLITQGVFYTKDKIKYFKRIFIMAILSEVPFNLLAHKTILYPSYQNVLLLFTIAIGTIILYEKLKEKNKDSYYAILIGIILSILLKPDYGLVGIILIYTYYFLTKKESNHLIKIKILIPAIFFLLYQIIENGIFYKNGFIQSIQDISWIYFGSLIAFILIYFYNGKLGFKNKFLNIIFYLFYPIHMIILYIIFLL